MKFELEEIRLTENTAHGQEEQYAVTLGLFPKAPLGEIAWFGFALGFDYFHVFLFTFTRRKIAPRGKT